ncbi:MAG: hypothetical protein B6U72_06275 [Candidatus Altiarchaeales archaeon ex4484_2]|nr:MAG: hypothetical protein B6U72_06275 [Candidatus Altiarchaeales archaeon ex4484_2]
MDTTEALKKYSWLEDYYWGLIDADKDEYTRRVDEKFGGYFLRILPGAKIEFPLQSCLMISSSGMEQRVHNIVIAEEGSEARVITGCTTHPDAKSGQHIGVSEFYIKKGARFNYTMIHNWGEDTLVRPRSVARLEDNSTFISNYVLLQPVKDLQMYPRVLCEGENATAGLNSIVYASRGSGVDIGSGIEFNAPGCRGEIISRVIALEGSRVTARGIIKGNTSPAKGHLECKGILLDDSSIIHAIPELVGARKDVDLSHEAAVGRIAEKEIIYLMSRGLSRDDATSIIVKGFLDVDILGLPEDLQRAVREILDKMAAGM